jgi:hypothetical protein
MLGLGELGDIVAGIIERDKLAPACEWDWIVKFTAPA